MILGKDCALHKGCFGVWPNDPCPYHEVALTSNLIVLDRTENEDVVHMQEELMVDKTYLNCDVRIFESGTWSIKTAAHLDLKKAVYLYKDRVGDIFRARASYVMGDGTYFASPIYVSSPDVMFRDCTFAGSVIVDAAFPLQSYQFYHCTFTKETPSTVSFSQHGLLWWEEK